MTRALGAAGITGAALLVVLGPLVAHGRLNLPHRSARIALGTEAEMALRALAARPPGQPDGQILGAARDAPLQALPPGFAAACDEIIAGWGEIARGTARLSAHLLHRGPGEPGLRLFWVALRCASTHPHYTDAYDERLGVVVVDDARADLVLVPHAPDAENDSELSRLAFARTLPLPGGTAVGITIAVTMPSPCCDGPTRWRGEEIAYYMGGPKGVREVARIVTRRDEWHHSDENGDLTIAYRATVSYERDGRGRVRALVVRHRRVEDDRIVGRGVTRYVWDARTQRFVQRPARTR